MQADSGRELTVARTVLGTVHAMKDTVMLVVSGGGQVRSDVRVSSEDFLAVVRLEFPAASGQVMHTLGRHQGGVFSLAFSADGQRLATTGAEDATIWRTWLWPMGVPLA
jgi:hypothetical protein